MPAETSAWHYRRSRRKATSETSVEDGKSKVLKLRPGLKYTRHSYRVAVQRACKRAGIEPAIGFHILRHTHGSMLAMKGVPLGVIAKQLGHADTRVTERHYAHLAPSYVAETIRASFPNLGITDKSTVVPISETAISRRSTG